MKTSVDATLRSGTRDDVEGCTNDWCLGKDGKVNEAGDALVVARFPDGGLRALLIRRAIAPFTGMWALPGGMHDAGELLTGTVTRELMEEVGVDAAGAVSSVDLDTVESTSWDPRFVAARVQGVAFIVEPDIDFTASDDAADAAWVPVEDIASGQEVLAFGHALWLARLFEADTPLKDENLANAFQVLYAAALTRNRALIAKINRVRSAKGCNPIPLDADEANRDTQVLRQHQRGRIPARGSAKSESMSVV